MTTKTRKPRDFINPWNKNYAAAYVYNSSIILKLDYEGFTPDQARRLAKFLNSAAAYLEAKEKTK